MSDATGKDGLLIGAHMSVAGGVSRAPTRGAEAGCAAIQIFTRNATRWQAPPLEAAEIARFRTACKELGIVPAAAHASYLVNLATPARGARRKIIKAMADELDRAEALGVAALVVHPGAHTGSGEEAGMARAVEAIDLLHERTRGYAVRVLLEITSGQGSCLGYRFEHIAAIINRTAAPERLGVCFDTCHAFAAGYDLRTDTSCRAVFRELDRVIGFEKLELLHLNDSVKELGCRRDRHAHIGEGCIGLECFRFIMRDRRFARIPKIIETPKGDDGASDRMNLATLRRLAAAP